MTTPLHHAETRGQTKILDDHPPAPRRYRHRQPGTLPMLPRLMVYALLILVTVFYIGPFAWMLVTSVKTTSEAARMPPTFFPLAYEPPLVEVPATQPGIDPSKLITTEAGKKYVLKPDYTELKLRGIPRTASPLRQRLDIAAYNYKSVLFGQSVADASGQTLDQSSGFDYILYARNTLLIALGVVVGSVLSSSLVAYALTKLHWYGRNLVFAIVLATMMLPFTVFMIPYYILFKDFGWIGTTLPLWAPSFLGAPFFIFLLRQFYITIPDELLDAARIDGCSEFRIWWQIIVPLSRPALAVVALFAFMGAWNDFLGPLVYLVHRQQFTLSLALQFFQSRSGGTSWELLMAASLLVIAPVIILFFLAQKTFIQGIATTGMKG
jgi:multiple sugar transport system permease protein